MDLTELKQLISMMNENELIELELEEDGRKIRLKKGPHHDAPATIPMVQTPVIAHPTGLVPLAEEDPRHQTQVTRKVSNVREITSPMVGTFYRAPTPESDPFVEIGDEVDDEKVLCIIEAMKVMNEIKAETEGEIVEVLVENGEAVEYGQALFLVKPA